MTKEVEVSVSGSPARGERAPLAWGIVSKQGKLWLGGVDDCAIYREQEWAERRAESINTDPTDEILAIVADTDGTITNDSRSLHGLGHPDERPYRATALTELLLAGAARGETPPLRENMKVREYIVGRARQFVLNGHTLGTLNADAMASVLMELVEQAAALSGSRGEAPTELQEKIEALFARNPYLAPHGAAMAIERDGQWIRKADVLEILKSGGRGEAVPPEEEP